MKKIIKLRDNKVFKTIMKILKVFIVVVFMSFVIVVFLQRFSDNKVSFFNYRMFTVISRSMEPKYKVGDVLFSKKIDPSKIKIGDAISYLGEKGDFAGKVITHQVVGIEKTANNEYLFSARGLTNLVEDPVVYERQLYGVVIHKSYILSLIYKIISHKIGFYLFIIIPFMYIIGSEIVTVMLDNEEKRRKNV